jgi:hypothetical protein
MLGYYWSVVLELLRFARSRTEAVMFWIVMAVAAVGILRPELPEQLSESVVRETSVGVMVIALGYAGLSVNYSNIEAFRNKLREAESLIAGERERRAIKTALGNSRHQFAELQQACFEHARPAVLLHREIAQASEQIQTYVHQFFDGGVTIFAGLGDGSRPGGAIAKDGGLRGVRGAVHDGAKPFARIRSPHREVTGRFEGRYVTYASTTHWGL